METSSGNGLSGEGRPENQGDNSSPGDEGWVTPPPSEWEGTAAGSRNQQGGEGFVPGPGMTIKPEKKRRFTFGRLLRDVVVPLVIAFGVAMFVQATVAKPYKIPTGSMLPTIQHEDRVLANRVVYHFKDIERGDVIVFDPPNQQTTESTVPYVKRVIGLPGDTVEIADRKTLVNGEEFVIPEAELPTYTRPPEVVPEGQLFVLGDNRNESSDSHVWGYVPIENVIGRVEVVYWPPKHMRFM